MPKALVRALALACTCTLAAPAAARSDVRAPHRAGQTEVVPAGPDGTSATGAPRQVLGPQTFTQLRDLVLPTADELAWKEVGWRASLWEGLLEAQARERPILLWAMNGHPLGCT